MSPARLTGLMYWMFPPKSGDSKSPSRACIQLMLPRCVLISPLCAMKRIGWALPVGKRIGAETGMNQGQVAHVLRVANVGEIFLHLVRRKLALVNQHLGRKAADVEIAGLIHLVRSESRACCACGSGRVGARGSRHRGRRPPRQTASSSAARCAGRNGRSSNCPSAHRAIPATSGPVRR